MIKRPGRKKKAYCLTTALIQFHRIDFASAIKKNGKPTEWTLNARFD